MLAFRQEFSHSLGQERTSLWLEAVKIACHDRCSAECGRYSPTDQILSALAQHRHRGLLHGYPKADTQRRPARQRRRAFKSRYRWLSWRTL